MFVLLTLLVALVRSYPRSKAEDSDFPPREPQTKAEDMYSSDGDAQQKDVDMDVEEARYYYGYYRPFPVYYGFRPYYSYGYPQYFYG